MRFWLEVYFSDKKQKNTPMSGIEPRTTDTRHARDATTAGYRQCCISDRPIPHPAFAVWLLLKNHDFKIPQGL